MSAPFSVERPPVAHAWSEGFDTQAGLEHFWAMSALYRADNEDPKWTPTPSATERLAASDRPDERNPDDVVAQQGLGGTLLLSSEHDGEWLQSDYPVDVGFSA